MFTKSTPRSGQHKQDTQPAAHTSTRVAAITATVALGAGLALAAPLAASAETTPVSYAQGRFLSGSVVGINLDDLAALEATTARNNGSQSNQISRDPLGVSALGSTIIHSPSGVQLSLGDIIDLGAVNQYAQADKDGSSIAASGAIGNDGGVGVGTVGSGPASSATIDLDSLLDSRFASVLSDLKLQAVAVGAQARGKLKVAAGDYSLAGLKLNFTSPALAGLSHRVSGALDPVKGELGNLNGANGALAQSLNGAVTRINPVLNILGANGSVHAQVTADLNSTLKPLLTGKYGDGAVSLNLNTGAVSVDLAKLLGGRLNSEPVGTEVLSDAVVNQILNGITSTVATLGDQILARVHAALANARVDVDATLNASTARTPVVGKTCADPGTGSGLGDLIGGIVGGVVCTSTKTLLPDLKTSLAVHVHGTVAGLVDGKASQATATLKLLGAPVSVKISGIVDGLGNQLANHLLDGSSAVSKLTKSLDTKLVNPAVTGLLGPGASVENALTDAVSVKLNNQDKQSTGSGSVFTETAVRVGVLAGLGDGVATINLAQASVGPNVTQVVDPGSPSDPGDPGTPTSPGSPSDPGGSGGGIGAGGVSAPTAFSNLAFTGVGIGSLIGIVLALMAAGAYLVREGYRRNSRRQTP